MSTFLALMLELLYPARYAERAASELPQIIHVSCEPWILETSCTFFFQDFEPEIRTCSFLQCR